MGQTTNRWRTKALTNSELMYVGEKVMHVKDMGSRTCVRLWLEQKIFFG